MKIIEQSIKGVYLIKPSLFKDKRGTFRRNFCKKTLKKKKIETKVVQANISENKLKFTLRGFHYQTGKYAEAKTLTCVSGEIYDIVVDIRRNSPTFKKWISFKINPQNRWSIHVPRGCSNAFFTLKNNTTIHYYSSNEYNSKFERGIRYNDTAFDFKWPRKPAIVSDKDRNHPNFK